MKMNKKEIAKFFAGLTAWEAIVHLSLLTCDMLPITWCNFTLTNTLNTIQIIIPGSISILLTYYAWFKKD
jgi:hypothetical protein